MTELLPCPYCGASGLNLMLFGDEAGVHHVACMRCNAEGPSASTHTEAIEAWNQRTSPPARPPLPDYSDEISDAQFAAIQRAASSPAPDNTALVEELMIEAAFCLHTEQPPSAIAERMLRILTREREQAWQDGAKAGLEEAARKATSFLVGGAAKGIPLRSPMPHEITEAIRAIDPAQLRKDR